MSSLLVASLGTDHHPFQRLVDWFDALAVQYPDHEVFVQHGYSRPPVVAAGQRFLSHADLLDLMRSAAVVVSHGGPGTIMDAYRAGRCPIVVPRDPTLGEHVDGHQLRFAQVIADNGSAWVATTRPAFDKRIVAALAEGNRPESLPGGAWAQASGLSNLAVELDNLPREAPRLEPMLRSVRRRIHR